MGTPLEIAGAHKRTEKGHVDWYYGGGDSAWPDMATALLGIDSNIRPGKTIGVLENGKVVEYIWPATGDVSSNPPLKTASVDVSGKADKVGGNEFAGNQNIGGNVNSTVRTASANLPQNVPGNTLFTGGNFNAHVSNNDYLNYGSRPTFGFTIDGVYGAAIYLRSNVEKPPLWFEVQDINGKTDRLALASEIPQSKFIGKFTTIDAMQAVAGFDGAYAYFDAGVGTNALEYIWDSTDNVWVPSSNTGASSFGQLSGVPSDNAALAMSLSGKVDKENGKGLSTNDFTNSYKSTLDNLFNTVMAFVVSGLSTVAGSPVATDNLITILSKLKYLYDNLGMLVRAVTLSGLNVTNNSSITDTDNLVTALGKAQAQINNRLIGNVASDAETQITTSVSEDNKFVSRLKLMNWWMWLKNQAQNISAKWTFNAGIRLTPMADPATPNEGDMWINSTNNVLRAFLGGIAKRFITVETNPSLSGQGERLMTASLDGTVNAQTAIQPIFNNDSDISAAISGVTFNNSVAYIYPANSKVMYEGQFFVATNAIYVAIADNYIFKIK